MRFLQKIKGVTLLTKCASLDIQKSLEALLLQIERSQLGWLGHVSRMLQKKTSKQALSLSCQSKWKKSS